MSFGIQTIGTSELEATVAEAIEIISAVAHTGVHAPAVRLDISSFTATATAVAAELAGTTDPAEASCLAELGRQMTNDTLARYHLSCVRGHEDNPTIREAFHRIAYAYAIWRPAY